MTFAAQGRKLPPECKVGQSYTWDGDDYTVTTITKAHYRGVEGELPFQYWDKERCRLRRLNGDRRENSPRSITATRPQLLYLGKAVEFDELNLKNLRKFEGWS